MPLPFPPRVTPSPSPPATRCRGGAPGRQPRRQATGSPAGRRQRQRRPSRPHRTRPQRTGPTWPEGTSGTRRHQLAVLGGARSTTSCPRSSGERAGVAGGVLPPALRLREPSSSRNRCCCCAGPVAFVALACRSAPGARTVLVDRLGACARRAAPCSRTDSCERGAAEPPFARAAALAALAALAAAAFAGCCTVNRASRLAASAAVAAASAASLRESAK